MRTERGKNGQGNYDWLLWLGGQQVMSAGPAAAGPATTPIVSTATGSATRTRDAARAPNRTVGSRRIRPTGASRVASVSTVWTAVAVLSWFLDIFLPFVTDCSV